MELCGVNTLLPASASPASVSPRVLVPNIPHHPRASRAEQIGDSRAASPVSASKMHGQVESNQRPCIFVVSGCHNVAWPLSRMDVGLLRNPHGPLEIGIGIDIGIGIEIGIGIDIGIE